VNPRVRALFALLDLRSGGVFSREYETITRTQWDPPERSRALQFDRLTALLRHAERHVPFYQERFAEYGVRAADVKDFADFQRIPALSKHDVVRNPERLLSPHGRRVVTRKATGGSTGERVVFYRDVESMARNFAHVLRNHTWTGLELGETHALLWGAHFDLRAQQRFANRVINLCLRQRYLDAFHMNRESMAAYYDNLRKWRPRLLSSYVTAATTLADYILDSRVPRLETPAVATTAEVLFPERREKIVAALGLEVYDRVGCREIGNTAHECSAHDGLHVNAEHAVMEIVDEHGGAAAPGTEGGVLYTSLGNYVFPLIRYQVGDYAVAAGNLGTCSCGRGLPKIRGLRGRVTDMLVTPDGTKVHGEYFSHLFYDSPSVLEFRVVQESLREVSVWLRLRADVVALTAEEDDRLRRAFESMFGAGVELEVNVVDDIPKTASGKHRFTESRVGTAAP
jgi:phenylacetate-CoA ligase